MRIMAENEGKVFTEEDYKKRLKMLKEVHLNLKIFKFFLRFKSWLKDSPKEKRKLKEFLGLLEMEKKKRIITALESHPDWVKLVSSALGWKKTLEVIISSANFSALRNEYRRRLFVEKIGKKSYKHPQVKFPSVFLSLKAKKIKPSREISVGRIENKKVVFFLSREIFPLNSEVSCKISPIRWEPFYGWIFQISVIQESKVFCRDYFIKKMVYGFHFVALTGSRRIADFIAAKKNYRKIRLETIERVVPQGSGKFELAFVKKGKKRFRLAVRFSSEIGKKIRMEPEPENNGDGWILNFFEITEGGEKFLKSYLLSRKPPFLKRIN